MCLEKLNLLQCRIYIILPLHQAFDLQCTRIFCHFIHNTKIQYNIISQNVKLRKFSDAFLIPPPRLPICMRYQFLAIWPKPQLPS